MSNLIREIHPDFQYHLDFHSTEIKELFCELREFVFSIYPESNELLYHTHALSSVFSPTLKLGSAFCHIPIYSNHFNLGFNKGTSLIDPDNLLQGTGKSIRHIPIKTRKDFNNKKVKLLIQEAVAYSLMDLSEKDKVMGQTISKIKGQ